MSPLRRAGIYFLLAQGLGAAAWWTGVLSNSEVRSYFLWPGIPPSVLLSMLTPDAALYIGGPILAAYGLNRNQFWAWPVLCLHTGAVAYSLLFTMSLSVYARGGWAGSILMFPSLLGAAFFAWRLRPGSQND